jgi:hypothetical protein
MNPTIRIALLCFLTALAAREALAADDQCLLAKPGKLLFKDDFARSEMPPKWAVGKGFWTVKDGVVTAAENPDDHHGAYAFINPNLDYKDVVAEFSFKLEGATDLALNMRDQRYKGAQAGHILRATIMPKKYQLADMKLGGMKWEFYNIRKDPQADPAAKKAVEEQIKDKTVTVPGGLDRSTWYQARVEVAGDELLLSIDGKPVAYLKSGGIDHPTKNMLGFSIVGKTASIKNPKFWAATANPDWPSHRAEIVGSIAK